MRWILIFTVLIVSCQTNRTLETKRSLASGQIFQRFIQQLGRKATMSSDDMERSILNYIRTKGSNSSHHNYQLIGITEDQAKQIKSLSDDLPFMPKVRKWAMENMDKIYPSLQRNVIADVYQTAVVGQRGLTNPYNFTSAANSNSRRLRSRSVSPVKSISQKQERILEGIREINNRSIENIYRKNLAAMQKRGSQNPAIFANGQEIVESAAHITRKTGLKAMGEGCEAFSKSASLETLEIKANVDLYRARLAAQRAENKAGRAFASVDEIPAELRLTAEELDDVTVVAFRDVLGYTDDEARAALNRLKKQPCRLY